MSENVPTKTCRLCQATGTGLLRCSKCKEVYYCNQECQRKDWPSHKSYCKSEQEKNHEWEEKYKRNELGLDEFGKLQHIGTGNFSIIFKTNSKKNGQTYAIKQIEKSKVKRMRKQADVFMEKHCLNKLQECSYVVKLYKTFQDEFNLYFQMECPSKGELWEIAKNFGIVSEPIFHYYVCHLVKALSILHNEYQIVHRDLKPENILLTEKNQIKLIDFGTAKDLDRPDLKGSGNGLRGKKPFEHYVGTPHYMAPECIHNQASEKKSDIYSLAGTLYFLKAGSPPFSGGSQYLVFTKSLETMIPTYKQLFSENLADLLTKMNEKDMDKRIDINEVMEHPYFEGTNFSELPSYEEAFQQVSDEEREYEVIIKELNELLMMKENEPPLQLRKQVYEQKIKPYLQKLAETKQNKIIQEKMHIIDLQCQVCLNTSDNTNESLAELYSKQ